MVSLRIPVVQRVPFRMQDAGVYVALALLLIYDLFFVDNFVTLDGLRTQFTQVVPVLLLALGMALVIGTEGIDLSVGSVMAIASALLPLYLGYGLIPGVVVALLAGAVIGGINGTLIAVFGVQPIVATLALLVSGRGLATVIGTRQKSIYDQNLIDFSQGRFLGIPNIVALTVVIAVLLAFVVRRTTFGRQLVAVGGNRRAAELAGLPVRRVLFTVYIVCGLLAALAGTIQTARLTASTPDTLGLYKELDAITAVVVGGTALSGGRVRILGTVAGAVLMQLIHSTLIAKDITDSVAQMVQAVIIVIAVYIQRSRRAA